MQHVHALGDCNGRGAFTHTSYNDYEIVAENLLSAATRKVSERVQAYALYIDPPLGRIGMTEADAQRAGYKFLIEKRPMTRVARAIEKGDTQGFIKIMVDADSKRILGAAISASAVTRSFRRSSMRSTRGSRIRPFSAACAVTPP